MKLTAMAPSPTADAQRLTDPLRTSPAANTPGRLVSRKNGVRPCARQRSPRGRPGDGRLLPTRSPPRPVNPDVVDVLDPIHEVSRHALAQIAAARDDVDAPGVSREGDDSLSGLSLVGTWLASAERRAYVII